MDPSASLRVQRVIFPVQDVDDVRALYLEGVGTPTGRESCRLPAGATVGLCTYFNAFPAGYWQHWTNASSVQVALTCDAPVSYRIWRSDATGAATVAVEGRAAEVAHELPLTGFDDGGLYWMELTAGETDTELISSSWSVSTTATAGTASIGITTFNRPSYCLDQLRRISAEPALLAAIDQVFVVD
jgi:galactofuranosylgalactofuranosylrhamnosyl-N-acetylglucosaminyl-diphospho-decaprenol beta-1,5/1,6-galactofuranosyltransferase